MTDKYTALRNALATGHTAGGLLFGASPDTIAALLAERDRLREALAIARDYVADEIAYLRAAFRGYEELGKVPDAEADLAQIDAVLGYANAHP